jgi:3-phenylpropionate/cinnamic acid dioxygenase small subunit
MSTKTSPGSGDGTLSSSIDELILQNEIEQTFYSEAALLDEQQYAAWLEAFAEELTCSISFRSVPDDPSTGGAGDREGTFTIASRSALRLDVEKRQNAAASDNRPLPQTRHWVSNVRILERHASGVVTTSCNLMVYQNRGVEEDWWTGRRVDRLQKVGRRWMIARREIYLDHGVLASENIGAIL